VVLGLIAGGLWLFPDAVSRLRRLGTYAEADPECRLDQRACTAVFADGTAVTLDVTPRGMPTETPLSFEVRVDPAGPTPRSLELQGVDMNMGLIPVPLSLGDDGVARGRGVVPVCTTERMRWHADVVLDGRTAGFGFGVVRDGAVAREASYGDFTLTSADGPLALSDLRGKVVVVYFGYTSCPDICPTTLQTLAAALGHLDPADQARVVGLMVSLDPARDPPEHLRDYTAWFHPNIRGVTGTDAEVAEVAARWGVGWRRVEAEGSALGYAIDHDSRAFLVAPDGHMVGFVRHGTSAEALARQLEALLR
jgi:protein SCO1/2